MNKETYNRLLAEREELSKKTKALFAFHNSTNYEKLSFANRILLDKQRNVMVEYLNILSCRIEINTPNE